MKIKTMIGTPFCGAVHKGLIFLVLVVCCMAVGADSGKTLDLKTSDQIYADRSGGNASVDRSSPVVWVARFSDTELKRWEETSFKGHTQYQVQNNNGTGVLRAYSRGAASAIGKRVQIDLTVTPYLNWTWKVDRNLEGIAETTRAGDDFAARIYLVKRAGILGRNSKAVNYVWSSNQVAGSSWPNAYTPKNSKMIAVRGSGTPISQWVTEKRNVAEDFQRLFGARVNSVDVVAIMTDSDNSGLTAEAGYADIFFSAE